jgi:hypothetical protein
MASAPELGKAYSDLLGIPFPTIDQASRHLRAAGLLTVKGFGRGGAEMIARDATTLLTALSINHARGGDYAREVKRVLNLPLLEAIVMPLDFADDLSIKSARNAGEALEFLIADTVRPRIRHPLESGVDCVTVSFDSDGWFVSVSVRDPNYPVFLGSSLYTFQRGERERRNIERNTTIHGRVLLEIAKLLELKVPD